MANPKFDYMCWECNKEVTLPPSTLSKNVTCPNCKGDLTAFKKGFD